MLFAVFFFTRYRRKRQGQTRVPRRRPASGGCRKFAGADAGSRRGEAVSVAFDAFATVVVVVAVVEVPAAPYVAAVAEHAAVGTMHGHSIAAAV